MTPTDAGAWWDPDVDAEPTARTPSDPRARIRPAPAAGGGSGETGDPVHEQAPSRWWRVGAGAAGASALVATVLAVVRLDGGWAALAVTSAVSGVLLELLQSRQPRRVSASPSGVEVSSRRHAREVTWEQLRRARGLRAVGFPQLDTDLELDTGELLRLPRRTPGGAVEDWRTRFGGGRPHPRLPQEWRLSPEEAVQQFSLLHNGGLLVALLAMNVVNATFDLPPPLFGAAYLAVLWLLVLVLRCRPARTITVDEQGLLLPGWRARSVPWSQVRDVRRKSRYEPQVVVEVSTGQQHEILGPGLDVVHEWWHLAVPADRRGAGTDS